MKVILQQDVKKVGKKGEIIEVSEGYGRNFLLPKKYAVEATASNLNVAKAQAKSAERRKAQATDEARLMAAQLAKVEITIPVKIGEGGKLFGSVTGKDIADALKKDHGIELDKRKIALERVYAEVAPAYPAAPSALASDGAAAAPAPGQVPAPQAGAPVAGEPQPPAQPALPPISRPKNSRQSRDPFAD